MDWLRSRWTVVALVPAFFLAGFGIVTALAGGSEDPLNGAAPRSVAREGAGPATVTIIQGTGSTETSSAHGSAASTQGEGGGGEGNGTTTEEDRSGSAPPAPRPGVVDVDYGRWVGIFELQNPEIVPDFGIASILGELRYLGGVDCPVGLVRVRAWFYNDRGHLIGATVWESVQSTGEGAEVAGREPLPFEAYGQASEAPASAALRFTAVECL
ncbi:MAG: hypothetical protein ACRDMY_03790 [Gaiellaceae bacterium]